MGSTSQWKMQRLGLLAPDLGDTDADGLVHLTEYALVLSPTAPSQPPGASVFTYADGKRLRMFVPRDPAHNDITVSVEATGDLVAGPWTPLAASTLGAPFTGPGYVGGDDATPGVKTGEVRDLVNLSATTQRWLRVKVTHCGNDQWSRGHRRPGFREDDLPILCVGGDDVAFSEASGEDFD